MPLSKILPARVALVVAVGLALGRTAPALDHIVLRRDDATIRVTGRVLVTAQDGGKLVQARDGVLWTVPPSELVEHTSDDAPFEPLSRAELTALLLEELPAGFDVLSTKNYAIFYSTSRSYAEWCGSLFERLYLAFTNFWSRKGFDLAEPDYPLVAIVFGDKPSYVAFSRPEVGDAVESIIGYYSLRTNRMVMYDLTGIESLSRYGGRGSSGQIAQFLRRPGSEQTVATIIHEATHQIAFNCGLHQRYSDCPLWFSEGIAIYFETPDLGSSRGWRTIGAVNRPRLDRFHEYLGRRPPASLLTLIRDDARFRDTAQSLDAYAEAWALTYFLLRRYPERYLAYLERLSAKKPLYWDDEETRIAEFKQAFGDDLERLDAEFVRQMARLR